MNFFIFLTDSKYTGEKKFNNLEGVTKMFLVIKEYYGSNSVYLPFFRLVHIDIHSPHPIYFPTKSEPIVCTKKQQQCLGIDKKAEQPTDDQRKK